jgi:hypothetical protein
MFALGRTSTAGSHSIMALGRFAVSGVAALA